MIVLFSGFASYLVIMIFFTVNFFAFLNILKKWNFNANLKSYFFGIILILHLAGFYSTKVFTFLILFYPIVNFSGIQYLFKNSKGAFFFIFLEYNYFLIYLYVNKNIEILSVLGIGLIVTQLLVPASYLIKSFVVVSSDRTIPK
jgi:hypothetical protein